MRILLPLLLLLACGTVAALPEQCFQRPQRQAPCEHLIYKQIRFSDSDTSELVCVCLQDYRELIKPAQTDAEKVRERMALKRFSAELGISEQDLLKLVRY